MTRFATIAACALLALPAVAEEIVPAEEIESLLSGNTITGTWSGTQYTQYFDANGVTVYIPEGRQPDMGRWRVNADTDQYESWWEQTGWTPYTVIRTQDGYAWKREKGAEPFTVKKGKQITW